MEAEKLYLKLEKDFIKSGLSDEWLRMKPVYDFITDNFKKRSMGLVCDNSKEINKVYTAVFPSEKIMKYVLSRNETDVLLFVHHPMIWDIKKALEIFLNMNKKLLKKFRERRISIYNLHVPLDNAGKYSTSTTFADALGIKTKKIFAPYYGALCGIFGKTKLKTVEQLKKQFESAVGHKVSLYQYGSNEIKNGKVAVVAGGGNELNILKDAEKYGVNVFLTGITAISAYSQKAHDFAKENGINIIGGTHYSTEKFACMKLCHYFKKLRLNSEFIEDKPDLADL